MLPSSTLSFSNGGKDILTIPVFDRPLFSADIIILFENLISLHRYKRRTFLEIPRVFVVTGRTT